MNIDHNSVNGRLNEKYIAKSNEPHNQQHTLGWRQLLVYRDELLAAFDHEKTKTALRPTHTDHGWAAEAKFREWLLKFLPKRYGVTAGYVVPQRFTSEEYLYRFDVIIYDALNSPILWIEENPDLSTVGKFMAIPAEHVLGILEVKSSFEPQTTTQAIEQLSKLKPLMDFVDQPNEKYKKYFPPNFFCACVFYELRKKHEFNHRVLEKMLEGGVLRGFLGGIILRGEGSSNYSSGLIKLGQSEEPLSVDFSERSLLEVGLTNTVKYSDTVHISAMLNWSDAHFSQFAFDIIALLQGNYHPSRSSSLYGLNLSTFKPD